MLLASLLLTSARLAAADAPSCERARAEARSQAIVLYAPRIELQGAYVPDVRSASDPTLVDAPAIQARVAAAMSPVEIARGRAIERIADSQCQVATHAERIDRFLAVGTRTGDIEGATAELAYLEEHRAEVAALVDDVRARLERQRATALDLDVTREHLIAIDQRIADRRSTVAMLRELEQTAPVVDLERELTAYREAAVELTRRSGKLRRLSAWRLDVRGGAAASDRADWFALVEIGYSLGGPWQGGAEDRAVRARQRELASDARDTAVRAEQVRRALSAAVEVSRGELRDLDATLAVLGADRDAANGADDRDATFALRARYTYQLVMLGARRAALRALIEARSQITGGTK